MDSPDILRLRQNLVAVKSQLRSLESSTDTPLIEKLRAEMRDKIADIEAELSNGTVTNGQG